MGSGITWEQTGRAGDAGEARYGAMTVRSGCGVGRTVTRRRAVLVATMSSREAGGHDAVVLGEERPLKAYSVDAGHAGDCEQAAAACVVVHMLISSAVVGLASPRAARTDRGRLEGVQGR